jgi:CbiX
MPNESRIRYGSVTDPSQAAEPQPQRGEPLPPRGEPLPRRGDAPPPLPRRDAPPQPFGDLLSQFTDPPPAEDPRSEGGAAAPAAASGPPQRDEALPKRTDPLTQPSEPLPKRGGSLPKRGESQPPGSSDHSSWFGEPRPPAGPEPQHGEPAQAADPLPRRGNPLPQRGVPQPQTPDPLPRRGDPAPQRGEPLPQRGEPLPQRGEPLPQRGEPPGDPSALPRRVNRTRRSGRHRSAHRLSLPSDAPTLLIAVPGSASPEIDKISGEIAEAAAESCQGAHIQVAYLEGSENRLDQAVAAPAQGPYPALAVIVPLLAGPQPKADAALQRAVAGAAGEVVLAEHLGPHPLLAEALHARLAQVGLARESRVRGLSISNAANGVLVLADRGDDAVRAAGVAAVLLAGRLAAPAVHASIDDPQAVAAAVTRLREMGASRVAIAPCVIGPETDPRELDAVSAATGALCAPPLGAHPAIGQLVAMRYGNALVGLRPADSSLG